jgi:hypothetical protein
MFVDGDEVASFGSGFFCVTALDVAWEDDPWVLEKDFAFVDMSECPVVISVAFETFDGAWGVVFVSFASSAGGVEQADIDPTFDGGWIGRGEVFGD